MVTLLKAAVQASRAAAAQQAANIQSGIVTVPEVPAGPPVTVFVGNISEKATDTLVRQILMKCGTVNNWKRVQGASGKLQAFGFCEFKEPDSALRALSLGCPPRFLCLKVLYQVLKVWIQNV